MIDDTLTNEALGDGVPFQRIRRITGYITGDASTWCDAKKSELKDRVVHVLSQEAVLNDGSTAEE